MQLKVNGDRPWERLMRLGDIGETEKGGSRRLALSDVLRNALVMTTGGAA